MPNSHEESNDDCHEGNLAGASENGQTVHIGSGGTSDCGEEICHDGMGVCETGSEEAKTKTASSNSDDVTIASARGGDLSEKSVHTSTLVGDNSIISPDIRQRGLYQNPMCEQDTQNPNLVYTQNSTGLNPMYRQITQDPNNPLHAPNTFQTSPEYAQTTGNPNQIYEPYVYDRPQPATGLDKNHENQCGIQPFAATRQDAIVDESDNNMPTADGSVFVQGNSAIPNSRHSTSSPNQMRAQNDLIENEMYLPNVRPRQTACALLWGTYRRTSVIVTIALMALLVFCATFAGLYFSTRVQDAEKASFCILLSHRLYVTTIIGTAHDNYGPAYFGCCSTSFARKEIDDLTSELTVGTTDRFVRNGEPTSNSSRDVTLPSTFNSSVSTPMRTPDSKSAPSKLTAHQTTMFFYTTKRTSKVSARSVVAPTSSPEKESYTEIFKSEKIIIGGGKGSSPGRFNTPNGVAVSSDNEIYVADRGNDRVQVFSMRGVFLRLFKTVVPGTNGQSMYPSDVAIDRKGYLWVAGITEASSKCAMTAHVVKYSREGLGKTTFRLPRTSTVGLVGVHAGIAVDDPNDRIIAIFVNIHIFMSNGSLIQVYERPGSPKLLGHYVTSGNEGHVIVSAETRRFVQVYNREGHRVVRFRIGTGKGNYPQGICTDSLGNIIVANLDKNRVDMFTSRGEFVRTVARTKPPNGIAIGPDGQLVVTHLERDIITIFPRQTVSS
ncbi:E3 ubiquitin-protein ligase TRIM32-like [Branchiostoma lanceolatum]|uniref:E3 ubiquitin-protein ligase TRIM32-like n=1 Tax=Branchiostoma lanceolatum TaxID=7740 RepID=UPI0034536D11